MSFELSSIITGLQKEGIAVADSGKTNAQRVGAAIHKRLRGRQAVDFVAVQLALVQLVEDGLGRLLEIDHSHVHEVVGSRLQGRETEALRSRVFAILAGIRGVVESVYGEAARIELFGDVSGLPGIPLELHRLGVRVHDQLTGGGFQLPAVQLEGVAPLDPEAVAAGLKRPLDRFGRALATLSLERRDAEATLFDKNEGVEAFKRTVRFAAGGLASLYGLAGFDDLAARIRPKRRASRQAGGGGPEGGGRTTGSESGGPVVTESTEPSSEGEDADDPARGDGGPSGEEPSGEEPSGEEPSGGATGPIGIVR